MNIVLNNQMVMIVEFMFVVICKGSAKTKI